ncbi:hypothetical protein GL218_03974 [Daldinia childiae]|uniref:uncharacterized protein n=1 Tax=Daldinia childiae TaxID=326645 RepID=UPI001444E506|nr:uncharacterized protein GL218_03974 [Daldinia childiae]KAF3062069.1 hypothetical protein GL218_03974 [Daldinia childiae]
MAAEERTLLLQRDHAPAELKVRHSSWTPSTRLLIAGVLISLSFTFTQVPILYAFRLMVCQNYYAHNKNSPAPVGDDQCQLDEVNAGTAKQISLLGITTTISGIFNLFVARWQMRKSGPRVALALQTAFPALRVAIQAVAIFLGGQAGIILIQSTQCIGILGGPAGYLFVLNTAIGEVVEPWERTGFFGKLQGAVMLGTAAGFLFGGIVGDTYGIITPFETAFGLFVVSTVYVILASPYISPKVLADNESQKGAQKRSALLTLLHTLAPKKYVRQDGKFVTNSGVLFLGLGIFLGVLGTGYAPILIQMYATAEFGFRSTENGYVMSLNSLIRGIFLIFLFPRIITAGRRWYSVQPFPNAPSTHSGEVSFPTHPEDFDPIQGIMPEQEPAEPLVAVDQKAGCLFDLTFLRWSLVADGFVTAYTAFATKGWHIYVAAFLLPLASGSAPAAKGVIVEMCPASQRADALQALTLIENIAMLSTLGLFGFVFAAFAEFGKAYLTFFCNAGVVIVAVAVLAFSRFPPADSKLVKAEESEAE